MFIPILLTAVLLGACNGQFCGIGFPKGVSISFAGIPTLSCGVNNCFGGRGLNGPSDNGGNDLDEEFEPPEKPKPECKRSFFESSCASPNEWPGGLQETPVGAPLAAQCCHYSGLKYSRIIETRTLAAGQSFDGGKYFEEPGRQTGYDVIKNIRKVVSPGGQISFTVDIARMHCIPEPPEHTNEVDLPDGLEEFLEKAVELVRRIPRPSIQSRGTGTGVGGGGGGGGGGACFSADSTVETETGERKTIDEIHIGDQVLSIERHQRRYVKVTSFLHRLPSTKADFYRFAIEDDNLLMLTSLHFVHVMPCDNNVEKSLWELKYAKDVRPGSDCMVKVESPKTATNARLRKLAVLNVTVVNQVGAYAPMTENGNIIVNGVLASCHNVVKDGTLMHSVVKQLEWLEGTFRDMFGLKSRHDKAAVELPPMLELFKTFVGQLLPSTKYEL